MGILSSKETNRKNPQIDPIGTTKYGQVRGKRIEIEVEDNGGQWANAFLGIPFARPPIGELRFRKPLPPECWEGIREAQQFPPQCPQADTPLFSRICGINSSEDCLYLNVFSPPPNDAPSLPLAVIVFIHGGGFISGNSQSLGAKDICKHFATISNSSQVMKNRLVFVTIQYRLGPLGFFSTAGDDACDDNVGLWDMTMALEWVQENIGAFGGDAQNVTLMGQSAGGVAVDLLALSPHSRDLFHKICTMSGNGNCEWALEGEGVRKCRQFAMDKLGVFDGDTRKLIKELRKISAQKLVMSIYSQKFQSGIFRCPLAPRIDGKFFSKSLNELKSEAKMKPRMLGVAECEGSAIMMISKEKWTLAKFCEFIDAQFPEAKYPKKFIQLRNAFYNLYLPGEEGNLREFHKNQPAILKATAELISDLFSGIPTQQAALEQIAHPNAAQTFLYSFDYCNPIFVLIHEIIFLHRAPIKAPTHSCDMFYLFKNDSFKIFGKKLMDKVDEKLVEIVVKMWSNFAKFGDPNGSPNESDSLFANFLWEPVSEDGPSKYLSIKPEPQMREAFQSGRPLRWIRMDKA